MLVKQNPLERVHYADSAGSFSMARFSVIAWHNSRLADQGAELSRFWFITKTVSPATKGVSGCPCRKKRKESGLSPAEKC